MKLLPLVSLLMAVGLQIAAAAKLTADTRPERLSGAYGSYLAPVIESGAKRCGVPAVRVEEKRIVNKFVPVTTTLTVDRTINAFTSITTTSYRTAVVVTESTIRTSRTVTQTSTVPHTKYIIEEVALPPVTSVFVDAATSVSTRYNIRELSTTQLIFSTITATKSEQRTLWTTDAQFASQTEYITVPPQKRYTSIEVVETATVSPHRSVPPVVSTIVQTKISSVTKVAYITPPVITISSTLSIVDTVSMLMTLTDYFTNTVVERVPSTSVITNVLTVVDTQTSIVTRREDGGVITKYVEKIQPIVNTLYETRTSVVTVSNRVTYESLITSTQFVPIQQTIRLNPIVENVFLTDVQRNIITSTFNYVPPVIVKTATVSKSCGTTTLAPEGYSIGVGPNIRF